jgi:predicted Fe-Mo cluster-binding NifX family protein
MRIVIPVRKGRVSPVFDVARKVLIVDVGADDGLKFSRAWLDHSNGQVRPQQLVDLGTDLLICGFISASLEESIASTGIGITGQVCGSVQEVLRAFLDGVLGECDFVTPGSTERAQRFRGGNRSDLQEPDRRAGIPESATTGKGKKMPRGDGSGPPRGGGRGRGGGPLAAGPGGECVCPKCGHSIPHVAGKPCQDQVCTRCGTRMTRK